MSLITTPSQTVGPFLRIGFGPLAVDELVPKSTKAEVITIVGRIFDGDGKPVTDAALEIWQANAQGKYVHPDDKRKLSIDKGFRGFGRVLTDSKGMFHLRTVKPGTVPGNGDTTQAPHLSVTIFMRGLLRHLYTRIYFGDAGGNATANAADPVLSRVPGERRSTLIARPSSKVKGEWEWNVVLQGKDETVFFDW